MARADSAPSAPSAGGNNIAAAKAAYEKGRRHYNVGQFYEAAGAFAASYQLSGNPTLLFNVGQAFRLAGQHEKAARAYKAFLREAPEDANCGFAETKLQEVSAAASTGEPMPVLHSASDSMLSRHNDWDPEVSHIAPPPSAGGIPRWAVWMGAGVTTALASSAIVFGLTGNRKYNNLRDGCAQTAQGCSDGDVDALASRARITNLLWIATAVAGVSTAVMFTFNHGRDRTTVSMAMRF